MDDFEILQQKIEFLEEFYDIKGLMDEYLEPPNVFLEAFLDEGSLTIFYDELLAFLKSQNEKMNKYSVETFIEGLIDGNVALWIDTIEGIFKKIEEAKKNDSIADAVTKRAMFALSMQWWRCENEIHDISPITHLKFQIALLYCMHIKTPITNFAALPQSAKQLQTLNRLIEMNPRLKSMRNKLERESGIDRATIRRLLNKKP